MDKDIQTNFYAVAAFGFHLFTSITAIQQG